MTLRLLPMCNIKSKTTIVFHRFVSNISYRPSPLHARYWALKTFWRRRLRFVDFAATSHSREPKLAAGSRSAHAQCGAGSSHRPRAVATVHRGLWRTIDVFLAIVSVSVRKDDWHHAPCACHTCSHWHHEITWSPLYHVTICYLSNHSSLKHHFLYKCAGFKNCFAPTGGNSGPTVHELDVMYTKIVNHG